MIIQVEPALLQLVSTAPEFTALAGSNLFLGRLPQDASYPIALFHKVSGRSHSNLRGQYRLDESIFQYDSFDLTAAGAKAISAAIRTVLEGFSGVVAGVKIGAIQFEGEHDNNFEPFPELYMVTSQYRVWHNVQ